MLHQPATLRECLGRLLNHLPRRRKRQGVFIVLFMLVGAAAELMTIGAILPFLALISDPNGTLQSDPRLLSFFGFFGWRGSDIVVPSALLFITMAIIAGGLRLGLAYLSQKFVFKLGYDLGVAVYSRTLYQPYSYHLMQNSAAPLSGINKVQSVVSGTLMPVMLGTTALVIAIFIFIALLLVDWKVALSAGLGFTSIYVVVSILTRKRLRRNSKRISQAQTVRIQTVQEGLGGIRDVILDHAQPVYIEKFRRLDSQLRDAQADNAFIGAAPRFVIEASGMVLMAVIALFLSRTQGGLTGALPTLGALALGAQRLLPLLQQIYVGSANLLGNRQSLLDVLALLDAESWIKPRGRRKIDPLPFEREIALKRLAFRYSPEGPLVLKDIDLVIPKGSRIGFIGKTGSGKSTTIDLIMGLIEPSGGAIEVDGIPIDPPTRPAWQQNIAHVPQAIFLLDDSIAKNIAFGADEREIDMVGVAEAARKAELSDFVEGLPQGYHTFVGERGVRLSGGQRQRIGIARALYKQTSVLILDEATSALDTETESAVMHAINTLSRDLTILIVAHRITTLATCDQLVHLKDGRVDRIGSYEELTARPARAHA